MSINNIEIKAKCANPTLVEKILLEHNADYIGIDNQTDTYFKVSHGRLKLREGNIENSLIHYHRENKQGPKLSEVLLYKTNPKSNLKDILIKSNEVLVVIVKERKIFFIENVKFHIDQVKGLGSFVEIEAIDKERLIDLEDLNNQCQYFINLLKIGDMDLISDSYSDLLINKQAKS